MSVSVGKCLGKSVLSEVCLLLMSTYVRKILSDQRGYRLFMLICGECLGLFTQSGECLSSLYRLGSV